MPYRKGEGYDWLLVGFGVLIAAIAAQEREAGALVLGFAGLDRERLEAYGPALLSLCRQEPSALDKS